MTTTTMNRGEIRLAGTNVVIDGSDCAQDLVRRQGGTAWKFHAPFSFTNAITNVNSWTNARYNRGGAGLIGAWHENTPFAFSFRL